MRKADLAFIETAEDRLRGRIGAGAVLRCRITHAGVIVELADNDDAGPAASDLVAALCRDTGRTFLGTRPYRRGAAFLRAGA